jgi:hypothetical protein
MSIEHPYDLYDLNAKFKNLLIINIKIAAKAEAAL